MRVRERAGGTVRSAEVVGSDTRGWLRRYLATLVAIDAFAAAVAAVTAYEVRFSEVQLSKGASGYLALSLALPALSVGALALARAYEPSVLGLGSEEFQRATRAFVGLVAVVGFVSYASKAEIARGYVVLALPLALVLCLAGRYVARKRLHALRRRGTCLHDVIAVGGEHSVADLVRQLRLEQHTGMRVVGVCLAAGDGHLMRQLTVPVLGGLDEVVPAVRRSGADTIAVTSCADIDPARLRRLAWDLEGTDTDLVVAPGLIEVAGPRLHIHPVPGLPLLQVEEPQFSGARRVVKGAVDRVAAGVVLLLLAPLLVAIAAGIRLTTPGPVIFRQARIGKDGRAFTMLKFRTMVADAEDRRPDLLALNDRAEGLLFKIRQDPRVTPIGRVLRKLSLDELPQLGNVLAGHMSLVGPRPPLPGEVELYEADARRRLLVKPGLTGLWQVSGRSDLTWDEAVRLDLRYVENWSLTLDLMILWKTGGAIIRRRGAY